MFRAFAVLLLVLLLSGCETLGGAWVKKSSIAFVKDSGGSLSIWNAEMSAAVAYNSGQICMQRALAVKTIDAKTSLKVSEAMLALSETARAAAASGSSADLVSVTSSLTETAQLLTTSTERTTFLDLGMFYTCQISANGGLTDTQTAELIRVISISGAAIGGPNSDQVIKDANSKTITPGDNTSTPKSAVLTAKQ
ncbi:hypothetical protein [Pseudohongiella acticola]|uniref:hypothetical protein n=1 Tax=Pseudohongiella acticola TaxID=1524254 RepID=UPI0011131266|nr:hypothetical protein [Pseudohongiella acticola]